MTDEIDRFALNAEDLAIWYGSEHPKTLVARANRFKLEDHRRRSRLLGIDVPESDEDLIVKLGGSGVPTPGLAGIFSNAKVDTGPTVFERAMEMMQATEGGYIMPTPRTIPGPDGSLFVLREQPTIKLGLSMSFEPPKADRMDWLIGSRFGFDVRQHDRIVTVVSDPMPDAPGVDAMIADCWIWTGWRFARDQDVSRPWSGHRGRYAGHISVARVRSGRYADRLPTNRKRKRERCKARRRARRNDR